MAYYSPENLSDALFAKVVSTCNSAFLIVDAVAEDSPIVFANGAFEALTGYAADEVLGRNCRFLHGTDRDQPGLHTIRRALRRHEPCRTILRNYRKDGSLFLNEVMISPLRDESGKVTHFVGCQNKVPYEKLAKLRDDALTRIERLTEREREVLSMLVEGHSNKMVARSLEISPRTAEKHRQRILRKMELSSVALLVRYAIAAETAIGPVT